jgi:hypothetical protein
MAEITEGCDMKKIAVLFVLSCLVRFAAAAEPEASAIHREIISTYSFQPHRLSSAQIAEKSKLLDAFWAQATAHKDVYVPALRRELADITNPPFFLYDGSKLLMSLSKQPADRKIVLKAVAHSDLQDLQRDDYFYFIHTMAVQGEDTTQAAFHIFDDPKFQVFIPQHALTLGQNYSLIYMVLPTKQSFWERPATMQLMVEKDATAQQSLLLLLFYAQTSAADAAIATFAKDLSKPSASRALADQVIKRGNDPGLLKKATASIANEDEVRQKRRERMKSVSDEALLDLDSMTASIAAKRK